MGLLAWRRGRRALVDGRLDLGAGPVEPPVQIEEEPDTDLDGATEKMETNGEWLNDLYQARIADEDEETPTPTLADLAPAPLEYVPPRGAVHNRQDIYEGGRRCLSCGVPAVADLCSRCVIGGEDDAA
jgi:hypothetical protein